ncbi:hypothetical protein GCM10009530_32550 [Microbispora corallina]|uniref:Uncharacterized protein n=1 Tax=Microbispora corallina TaxID=83302 RepID=A0ABQ4GBT5_9ACTN|nr:hypothetical protein Mco01_75390 [Microbispora corallina]
MLEPVVEEVGHTPVRTDRPVSFAAAFEAPVRPENGLAAPSCKEVSRYAERLERLWGTSGVARHGYAPIEDKPLAGLGEVYGSFAELMEAAVAAAHPGSGA